MHQEVVKNLESIHGALLRMNRSIQAEGTFGIMKNDRWYKRIVRRGIHSVIYTQQVQKGRCEKTQSSFFTSPFVIREVRGTSRNPTAWQFGFDFSES